MRETLFIFLAGVGAGAINAIAGGGTLISFPVLLWLGRDPIVANASNAVALWPGSLASAIAFRRELAAAPRLLRWLLPPSAVGAALGGWLLLETPTRLFTALIPFLILGATVLIALKRPLLALRRQPAAHPAQLSASGSAHPAADTSAPSTASTAALSSSSSAQPADQLSARPSAHPATAATAEPAARNFLALALIQLAVAVYGGYFGAAMGIMMLATFGLSGLDDIHQRNGLKNVCATLINAIAGIVFILGGAVDWADAGVLATGAILGGYLGAAFGRRLPQRAAEALVIAIGVLAAATQLLRR